MDVAGAESLRQRIEQQAHWEQAEAVRDGRQPATDPDSSDLDRFEDGVRHYAPRMMHGELVYMCKRIVNGVWELGLLAEPSTREPEPAVGRMAQVA